MRPVYDLTIARESAVSIRNACWVATGRGTEEKERVKKTPLPNLAVWRRAILHLGAALLLTITALGWNRPALAQDERRIKSSVPPRYPELARQNQLYGSARLQVLIARDGTVKEIKVLGGSPLLVQASIEAVKQWKYEPASVESSLILKFDFKP
jgi:TonB family protein